MRGRRIVGALLALVALLAASAAAAKDFGPGDLRVCNRTRCVPITNRDVLHVLSSFYYGSGKITVAPRVGIGAPAFELRTRDGFARAIVATVRLDRFGAHGFNCGRFTRGRWYRLPAPAARELRRLTARLEPLRVTRAVPRSC